MVNKKGVFKELNKTNKPSDLFWIIPEILGELFFHIWIPVKLIYFLNSSNIFTTTGLLCLGVIYILIVHLKLNSIRELLKIKW